MKKRVQKIRWSFITKTVFGLLTSGAFIFLIFSLMQGLGLSPEKIRNFADQFGIFSILVLIILMMLSVMSPLPDTPIGVASIIIFGPFWGFVINYVGTVLGATADFFLARKLGRKHFERKFPKLTAYANKTAGKFGFELIIITRMFPAVSFDISSYVSALTKVKSKIFISASMIGAIVPAVNYTLIGLGVSSGNAWQLTLSLLASAFIMLVVILFIRAFLEKKQIGLLED